MDDYYTNECKPICWTKAIQAIGLLLYAYLFMKSKEFILKLLTKHIFIDL